MLPTSAGGRPRDLQVRDRQLYLCIKSEDKAYFNCYPAVRVCLRIFEYISLASEGRQILWF